MSPYRKGLIEALAAGVIYTPPRFSWQSTGSLGGKRVLDSTQRWLKGGGHMVMVKSGSGFVGVHPTRACSLVGPDRPLGRSAVKSMRALGYVVSDDGTECRRGDA